MARPKATGETKSHQQHLLMSPSEIKAIDDWRFENRIGSRGEAIRRLCTIGLLFERGGKEIEESIVAGTDALQIQLMKILGALEQIPDDVAEAVFEILDIYFDYGLPIPVLNEIATSLRETPDFLAVSAQTTEIKQKITAEMQSEVAVQRAKRWSSQEE